MLATLLVTMNLSDNALIGTLPESLGLWTQLPYFSVATNQLEGTLPESIGQATLLVYFDVAYNAFTGTLPVSVGQWTNLVAFSVTSNALTESLPSDISNWKNIATVKVAGNSFTGSIPNDVCNAMNLTSLEADCSELSCSCCTVCHYRYHFALFLSSENEARLIIMGSWKLWTKTIRFVNQVAWPYPLYTMAILYTASRNEQVLVRPKYLTSTTCVMKSKPW
jgi:hypothetical protein